MSARFTNSVMCLRPSSKLNPAFLLALAGFFSIALVRVNPCLAQIGETTSIGSGAFVKSTGDMEVNQAAGVGNQEVNFAVVTQSPTVLSVKQGESGRIRGNSVMGSASISGNAFAQSNGMMQVTQASGAANMLANAAFVGVDSTTDNLNPVSLAQVSYVPVSPNATAASFQGQAAVAPTAFAAVTGVVQVDQTAGNNNVAANQFSLHFEPGTVR